jgi:hypothetical protein
MKKKERGSRKSHCSLKFASCDYTGPVMHTTPYVYTIAQGINKQLEVSLIKVKITKLYISYLLKG